MTALLAFLKPWRNYAIAGLIAVALTLWVRERNVLIAKGRMEERVHNLDSLLKVQAARTVVAETVYVRDTLRFTKVATRTDTLRETVLEHITDTLVVKQFIAASDSTIQACRELVRSCDAVQASLRGERDLWKARAQVHVDPPSHSLRNAALTFGAGVLAAEATRYLLTHIR